MLIEDCKKSFNIMHRRFVAN